jgi:hypothetical protein
MKKYFTTILMSLIVMTAFSQTLVSKKINELQLFVNKNLLWSAQEQRSTNTTKKIWVNKTDKSLELTINSFSLDEVKFNYRFYQHDGLDCHYVEVKCKDNLNCIHVNFGDSPVVNTYESLAIYEFNSKSSCYTFINLVGELKKLLN